MSGCGGYGVVGGMGVEIWEIYVGGVAVTIVEDGGKDGKACCDVDLGEGQAGSHSAASRLTFTSPARNMILCYIDILLDAVHWRE